MSKHINNRKRHQRPAGIILPKKWLPLILIGIVGLVGIGAVVIFTNSGAADDGKVTGAPAIEVTQSFFDLGDMRFNQMAQVSYEVRNVGDQPLQILEAPRVQVLEGC